MSTIRRSALLVCGIRGLSCLDVPQRPACSARALDALEARYVAEVAEACPVRGPCAELPAIERRYEAAREAWIRCR